MKRTALLLTFILCLALATPILAADKLTADVYTSASPDPDANNNDSGFLSVSSSGGVGACTPVNETFLKFDLSGVTSEVSSTANTPALKVEVIFGPSTGTGNLTLYSITDDSWTETGITHNNKPTAGVALVSLPLPLNNSVVSFSSAQLVDYINSQTAFTGGADTIVGNNVASFLLRIDDCTSLSNQIFLFERGGTFGGSSPAELVLFNPTAVTLQSIQANGGAGNDSWIWVALVVSLGLAAGGLGTAYRQRRAR